MAPRPRDRKAQIARASAEAFSALGYHGVTMEDIASRVGVSATALYRHYSGKYELFRGAVLSLGQQLVDATALPDSSDADDPRSELDRLVAALADTALANRESGGLYRWEGRFLSDDDQAKLNRQLRTVHHRIQRPLAALRPGQTSRERWTCSTAILSVIGSIVDHRSRLPNARIRTLLTELTTVIATSDLVVPADETTQRVASVRPTPESKYEALLDESMRLFNEKGYRDTSVEEIAAAVGPARLGRLPILRPQERTAGRVVSPRSRLVVCEDRDHHGGRARSRGRPDQDDRRLRRAVVRAPGVGVRLLHRAAEHDGGGPQRVAQSATVDRRIMGRMVVAVRPAWTAADARFAVHAAMALVVDIGRLTDYHDTSQARAMVSGLLDLTLLGRYRLRMALPAT